MNFAPGWYFAPGSNDVRWWDGTSFRGILLINGRPKYENFTAPMPTQTLILGILFVFLAVMRGTVLNENIFDVLSSILFACVGVLSIIMAINGFRVAKIAPPVTAPVWEPSVMPLPGQTEQGMMAPGWYPTPSARTPRWWSGARWSEYLLVQGKPLPVYDQTKRMMILRWIAAGVFVIGAIVFLAMGLTGEDYNRPIWFTMTGVFLAVAVGIWFYFRHLAKIYTIPTTPPLARGY